MVLGAYTLHQVVFKCGEVIGWVGRVVSACVQSAVASLVELVHFKTTCVRHRLSKVWSHDVLLA